MITSALHMVVDILSSTYLGRLYRRETFIQQHGKLKLLKISEAKGRDRGWKEVDTDRLHRILNTWHVLFHYILPSNLTETTQ